MPCSFHDQVFAFTQPDGTKIEVRARGNQYHAVFETLDGFTVVKSPVTGFFEFAKLDVAGATLEATGVRADEISAEGLGLARGLRLAGHAAKTAALRNQGPARTRSRWEIRRARDKAFVRGAFAGAPAPAPPRRETVGDFVGLCLLIQFNGVPGSISVTDVDAFCNQSGYSDFGNRGSVYDFFRDSSGGRLRYTNVVVPYYTAKQHRNYYTDPAVPYGQRTVELIHDALGALKNQSFDFGPLTVDDEGYVYAMNVFYAGENVNNWREGLWPHAHHLPTPVELAPGKHACDYQITNMGQQLTLGTFCHENGHMICDFPDLYDYGDQSRGVGAYCLMCEGGNVSPANPIDVCAYLKYQAGWARNVIVVGDGPEVDIAAGVNDFFLHRRSSVEYFIVENRQRVGRDADLPTDGLAIWHVDELGSNEHEQMTPALHYECALIQADNGYDLERNVNGGDIGDLYSATINSRFGDETQPRSRWWDGSGSGLSVENVGPSSAVMRFSVTA